MKSITDSYSSHLTGNTALLIILVLMFTACNSAQSGNEGAMETTGVSGDSEYVVELVPSPDDDKVDVFIDGDLFTSYIYSASFKKPVLYPLVSSGGAIVTRGYPIDPRPGEKTDHPHQTGLWLNYGDVNGLDFWNNSNSIPGERSSSYGTVVHRELLGVSSGDEYGELEAAMDWVSHDGEVLLEEHTTFLFRQVGNKRMIDRTTRLAAPDQDVELNDNKEGFFGIRMAQELEHPDEGDTATGIYRSSEGLEGHDVWGTRARWMNLSGQIGDEQVSVVILDHPDNVGYPTYWHARGYGLYAANPLGQREMSGGEEELNYRLAAGESVTFTYRTIIYSGEEATDEQVESDWQEFTR